MALDYVEEGDDSGPEVTQWSTLLRLDVTAPERAAQPHGGKGSAAQPHGGSAAQPHGGSAAQPAGGGKGLPFLSLHDSSVITGLAVMVMDKGSVRPSPQQPQIDMTINLYECSSGEWAPDLQGLLKKGVRLVKKGDPDKGEEDVTATTPSVLEQAAQLCLRQAQAAKWFVVDGGGRGERREVCVQVRLVRVGRLFRPPRFMRAKLRAIDLPVLGLVVAGLLYNTTNPVDLLAPDAVLAHHLSLLTERLLDREDKGLRHALRYLLGTQPKRFSDLPRVEWVSKWDGLERPRPIEYKKPPNKAALRGKRRSEAMSGGSQAQGTQKKGK